MSRNGLGTYSRVPGSAYTNGTVNDGSELDAEMNDIATALTDSLTADGQKTWAANQKAGTYKITGLGAGSASTDSTNLGQVQAQAYAWLTSVSGTDTITASATPAITAYAAGQTFRFIPANANTGAATINISGLGAKSVTKYGTVALTANDLATNVVYEILYDGTQFQIIGAFQATGTFTPTVVSSGGGAPTYSIQVGRYTRIGNRVTFNIHVALATTGTLAAGNVTIAGLPFATANVADNKPAFSVLATALNASITSPLTADAIENTSSIRLFSFSAGSVSILTVAGISGTSVFRISGSYEV